MFKELTKRELEVCHSYIKTGGAKSYINLICQDLNIGKSTVKTHITNIYQKLLINSKSELMHILLTNTSQLANCSKQFNWYDYIVSKREEDNNEKIN